MHFHRGELLRAELAAAATRRRWSKEQRFDILANAFPSGAGVALRLIRSDDRRFRRRRRQTTTIVALLTT